MKRLFQLPVGLSPLRHHKDMKRLFQLPVDLSPLRHHKDMKRLFQLPVGLSPLRHHKKRHSFEDTPSDAKCLSKLLNILHFTFLHFF